MPANLIKAISKECKISTKQLEKIWDEAKEHAGEKYKNNYGYITSIFKKMLKGKHPECYKKYFKESKEVIMKIKILNEQELNTAKVTITLTLSKESIKKLKPFFEKYGYVKTLSTLSDILTSKFEGMFGFDITDSEIDQLIETLENKD